ncbi:MAG: hypothetical protein ACHQ51_00595 [Elusimicrobiota bacterium]
MKRPSRRLAAVAALAMLVQSTGAASLPVAVLHAPGAFPPPAGRLAAFPPRAAQAAPAKPSWLREAAKNWLESAGVVARALLEAPQAPEAAPSAPASANETAPSEEINFIAAPPRADAVTPATDRMLVVMAKGESVEAVLAPDGRDFSARPTPAGSPAGFVSAPFPTVADFHENWIEQGGLRARVTYLHPHGTVTGTAEGYRAAFADGSRRFAPVRGLTAPFLRSFPIYWHDETVEIELTVENNTGRLLRHVRVEAGQETFRPVGTEGRRTAPPVETAVADELAPGARATVRWKSVLRDATHGTVNLEQTHVRVNADAAGSSAPATMLDAPQAGAVDPPGPALMP